ncbi:MAG: hypothetical protein PHI35_03340, partial [Victivallaceae bacterium]|nr:hypothetical protein [Victivallaceae bacterium]
MFSCKAKYLIALTAAAMLLMASPAVFGGGFGDLRDPFKTIKSIRADSWHIVGKNIVVEGNVFVPTPDVDIFADKAVINIENEDIEATGDIRFVRWYHTSGSVTPERLAELERGEDVKVTVTGVSGDLWGERQIAVKADGIGDSLQ